MFSKDPAGAEAGASDISWSEDMVGGVQVGLMEVYGVLRDRDALRSRWFGEQMRDEVDEADRSSTFLFWCLENEGLLLITITSDKMSQG